MHASAAEKRGLWEGVVQEPLRRAFFCVFLCSEVGFLLQISQKFLSEIAPPMQAFSGKPPREKPQNAAAELQSLKESEKSLTLLLSFRLFSDSFEALARFLLGLWACRGRRWETLCGEVPIASLGSLLTSFRALSGPEVSRQSGAKAHLCKI